jgi:hypothetical protein
MKGETKMKSLIKVTGLIALAGAAFFALNAGSALAGPPPPFEDEVIPHIPFDPGPELDLPPLCEMTGICDHLLPIDPCILTDTCGFDDSAADDADDEDESTVVDPTATPTDEPTATPTDQPTATPTDEPTTAPTDTPPTQSPTAGPQPGNLPPAGDNGGIMNDVGGGVVLLAGISLGAMALAWVLFFASRKVQTQR